MKKSKTAFTMIEIIFVIIILGILAAVAVPKLAATRADTKVSVTAQNIMTAAGEIASYATTKAFTDTNLTVMSNAIEVLVSQGKATLTPSTATITVGTVNDCVTLKVITGLNDENLTISFGVAGGDSSCQSIQGLIDARKYPMQLRGRLITY